MTGPSEAERYDAARTRLAATLRGLYDPPASPLEAALQDLAGALAGQLEAPSPLDDRGILTFDMVLPERPQPSMLAPFRAGKDPRCYQASFGPVHYWGCGCKR